MRHIDVDGCGDEVAAESASAILGMATADDGHNKAVMLSGGGARTALSVQNAVERGSAVQWYECSPAQRDVVKGRYAETSWPGDVSAKTDGAVHGESASGTGAAASADVGVSKPNAVKGAVETDMVTDE
eukprot:6211902-Pleurochrysis_carterae.AAC.2